MASLSSTREGRRIIQFSTPAGNRKTLHLGSIDIRHAQAVHTHVEQLLIQRDYRQPLPAATAQWLSEISDRVYEKLEMVGLVETRGATTLATFIDNYIARRTDLKPRTLRLLRQVRDSLVVFFGADRKINAITRADAKDWRREIAERYAQATVSIYVKKARQFLADAVERKLIQDSPFRAVQPGSQRNHARMRYVPVSDIWAVIEHCPSTEWKLLFALARFGGLRVPSETSGLCWNDIDWQRNRLLVHSPKTEHHQGHESRVIPLFPELLPLLLDQRELVPEGTVHVLPKLRGKNPRTMALKIIKRAGVTPWPKLFQNLRSSCETDLTARFPLHVACQWVGNTQAVALKHYLQVTDTHFEMATGEVNTEVIQPAAIQQPQT